MKRIINLLLLCMVVAGPVQAAKAEQEVLTRGDAVMLLSASDFLKRRIGDLLSWTVGYDISKVNRVNLTPTINYIRAVPRKVPPDGRTIIEIEASVDDPGGLANIAGVRADLSSIGRLPNTMLVDSGLYGDKKTNDGLYTLQTSVSSKVEAGQKEIPVAVANKKGWLAMAKTTLDIRRNPVIIEAKFTPEEVSADGKTMITLAVKIENPGRIEDLERVTADLSPLGYSEKVALRNDGKGGDQIAGDSTFTAQFAVPEFVPPGTYKINIEARNRSAGYTLGYQELKVVK